MNFRNTIYQSTSGAIEHLESGSRVIYIGTDITAPALHPGHLITLLKLKLMQDAGHNIIIIFGGGTSLIGDPTDRNQERPLLSAEQIEQNITSIQECVRLVLGDKPKFLNNKDWLCKINFIDMLREVGRLISVNKLVKTDTFHNRLSKNQHLSFLEFAYPVCQAYDFLYLNKEYGCTVQCGGSDQWVNILAGASLKSGLFGITCSLLTDGSGKKISKSTNVNVCIHPKMTTAFDFWQFFRNLPDYTAQQINTWFALSGATDINEIKVDIANYMTTLIHGPNASANAYNQSVKIYEAGDLSSLPLFTLDVPTQLHDVIRILGLAKSGSDARQLIRQGGVLLNSQICNDECKIISISCAIQVRKKGYQITFNQKS